MNVLIKIKTYQKELIISLLEDIITQDLDETGEVRSLLQDLEAGGEV